MFWDLAENHKLVDHKLVDRDCNIKNRMMKNERVEESMN